MQVAIAGVPLCVDAEVPGNGSATRSESNQAICSKRFGEEPGVAATTASVGSENWTSVKDPDEHELLFTAPAEYHGIPLLAADYSISPCTCAVNETVCSCIAREFPGRKNDLFRNVRPSYAARQALANSWAGSYSELATQLHEMLSNIMRFEQEEQR